jgi:uncharacterized protein YaiL (DUF2058 family)
MSTSLRDQLLKAGLISKKQADDTERTLEHRERQARRPPSQGKPAAPPAGGQRDRKHGHSDARRQSARPPGPATRATAPAIAAAPSTASVPPTQTSAAATTASLAQSAKLLRDQALDRQQQEKAEKKAKIAAVRQMIEQHRLTLADSGDPFHFVDGTKIRQIPVDAALRSRLVSGELVIVRYYGRYDIVPKVLIARLRDRDEQVIVAGGGAARPVADAEAQYPGFAVPDDLIW